jgi:hypothetical protein
MGVWIIYFIRFVLGKSRRIGLKERKKLDFFYLGLNLKIATMIEFEPAFTLH